MVKWPQSEVIHILGYYEYSVANVRALYRSHITSHVTFVWKPTNHDSQVSLLFHGLKCCCRASFCFCWNLWALASGCNKRPEFGVENYIFNKTIYMHFISRAKLSSTLATRSLEVLPTALGEFKSNEFWTPQPVGRSSLLKRCSCRCITIYTFDTIIWPQKTFNIQVRLTVDL